MQWSGVLGTIVGQLPGLNTSYQNHRFFSLRVGKVRQLICLPVKQEPKLKYRKGISLDKKYKKLLFLLDLRRIKENIVIPVDIYSIILFYYIQLSAKFKSKQFSSEENKINKTDI